MSQDEFLTPRQVLTYLKISSPTLHRLAKQGVLLPTIRQGKRGDRLYSFQAIQNYLKQAESHWISSTS